MSLQIHESCGHPAELDRVMGWEANFSGTSFLEVDQLGKLRYGSDAVTIVVDNTLTRGMATCGYDDEGTKSGRSDIVRNGVLAGYEMSNDTARDDRPREQRMRSGAELGVRADDPHVQSQPAARATSRSNISSTTSRTASIWRATARGRSTTGV